MIKSKIVRAINNRIGNAKFKLSRKAKRIENKRKSIETPDEEPPNELVDDEVESNAESNEATVAAEFKERRSIVEITDGKQVTIQEILEKIPSYKNFSMVRSIFFASE